MSRTRLLVTRYGLDALVVVGAVSGGVGTALRDDPDVPTGTWAWIEVVAITAVLLILLLRRRFPFGAPAALWLGCAALSFADPGLIAPQPSIFLIGLVAAVLLGGPRQDAQARVGLAIVVGGAAVVIYNDPTRNQSDYFFTPLLFAIAWLVGYALRERTEQTEAAEERARRAERDREAAARVAVAEERGRIARELHDVVAHAVSVMVLQVGAVRHRMPESESEMRDALGGVEQAGRTALAEMRRLLGAMRQDEDAELVPLPGTANLSSLVDDVRAAGLDVDLQVLGRPVELPPGLDLSVYRIVQEALTNVLKHAGARRATAQVRYGDGDVVVEVRDDGQGASRLDRLDGGPGDALGHGLVGIGERVKIYGGEMSAGPSPEGGFVLCARLPLEQVHT